MTKIRQSFKNFLEKIRPLKNSSAAIMTSSYMFLLVMITLGMGVSLPAVLGYQLVQNQSQEASQYLQSLQKTNIDSAHDWRIWMRNNVFDNETIFIKAQSHTNKVFYSEHAARVANKKHHALFFSKHYLLDMRTWYDFDSYHFYFTQSATQYGNHFTVWINLYKVVDIIKITLSTVLIVIALLLIFGIWRVWQLSQSLTRSLSEVSTAIKHNSQDLTGDGKEPDYRLPEPATPIEVHELASSFNQLLDALSEKEKLEKQFVSDASHELKTPIAAINGHLKLIARRGKQHPEIIADSLKYISSETQRMQHLVENLLNLSHAQGNPLEITLVDIGALLADISDNAAFGQTIKTDFPTDIYVKADLEQLREILLALLENASKYSPKKSTITISAWQKEGQTHISVADQGQGISPQEREKIFERFYRVDTSHSNQVPGSGLGLAIVKKLADRQNIQIRISDNHPHGTIFELILQG
ncbi:MAG: ATP-binding protein [Oenococcus sp.]|uniref:sensor histidine kinase n=1 Tax=Oenococcus TaxID=46254 RepID=UPI0021E7F90B|nr:ATP-binding protein [Oenococcus kitaharae]MCV3295732.1 ATP-binding protein [Oenococcus kitaharae]